MELPKIIQVEGRPRLVVDGKPFLILGLQWDCDSCFSPAEMNPLFPHAARMGANTAALPTYWREIEPTPGKYDFTMVDERLRMAKENNIWLVLLWFATWKNACSFYAPDYIRGNPQQFPLALDREGQPTVSQCPSSQETWQRDRDALAAMMAYLRDHDHERRVISVQIENEPGILGSDRCYCSTCTQRFIEEKWENRYGVNAQEAFSVVSIAKYIDRLAVEMKQIYPIPLYTNVWLANSTSIPGRDYPSGGGVPLMFDLFRQNCSHLELVAPDIYSQGYRDFERLCTTYTTPDNPLYIAEHSSSLNGRSERNVFYAIGQHGALGFDPWAIDTPCPEWYGEPLVDSLNGKWALHAEWLRDSYVAISRAVTPIVNAQGTQQLFTFVQEPGESGAYWNADGYDAVVTYTDREGAGRGMVIQRSAHEFVIIGVGFNIQFRRPRPDGKPAPVVEANWGYFDDDAWVTLHPMRRERPESMGTPIKFLKTGVAKAILG
jgi:hypothetical protein